MQRLGISKVKGLSKKIAGVKKHSDGRGKARWSREEAGSTRQSSEGWVCGSVPSSPAQIDLLLRTQYVT